MLRWLILMGTVKRLYAHRPVGGRVCLDGPGSMRAAEHDGQRLEAITSDRNCPRKHVDRAQVIPASAGGGPVQQIALQVGTSRLLWRAALSDRTIPFDRIKLLWPVSRRAAGVGDGAVSIGRSTLPAAHCNVAVNTLI
jgi:hypothetical protein